MHRQSYVSTPCARCNKAGDMPRLRDIFRFTVHAGHISPSQALSAFSAACRIPNMAAKIARKQKQN